MLTINDFKNNNMPKKNILTIPSKGLEFTDANIMGGVKFEHSCNTGTDITIGSCPAATIDFQLENLNNLINEIAGQEVIWRFGALSNTDEESFKSFTEQVWSQIEQGYFFYGPQVTEFENLKILVCVNGNIAYIGSDTQPYLSIWNIETAAKIKDVDTQPTMPVKSLYIEGDVLSCGHDESPFITQYTVSGNDLIINPSSALNDFQINQILYRNKRSYSANMQGDILKEYTITTYDMLPVNLAEETYEFFQMGIFIAQKPTKKSDTKLTVKSYDRMIKFDVIVDDWLSSLTYPITLKNYLVGLCNYVGVELATTSFTNENFLIQDNFQGTNVKGRDCLKYIGEVAGKFLVMNEQGKLTLDWYREIEYAITNTHYRTITVQDYNVQPIDKLQVQVVENDIGVIVGTGTNAYRILNNPLLYAETDAEIRPTIENIFNVVKGLSYVPHTINVNPNPLLKIGDIINVTTRAGQVFKALIMSRKMSAGLETYSATGNETISVNQSTNKQIMALRGKTNTLERTIEKNTLRIDDVEQGYNELSQTVNETISEIANIEGNVNTLTQTVNSFGVEIENVQGDISEMLIQQGEFEVELSRKARVYRQEAEPTGDLHEGDLWYKVENEQFIYGSDSGFIYGADLGHIYGQHPYSQKPFIYHNGEFISAEDSDIENLKNNTVSIKADLDSIGLLVESADGRISSLEVTSSNILGRVTDAEGNIGSLQITSTSITSRLDNINGSGSSIEQFANSITSRVTDAEGNIGQLELTANSFETRISSAEGNITSIKQTTDDITLAVNNSKLVFNSDGLTIKNSGFKIQKGSTDVFYLTSSGDIRMNGELYNVVGNYGVRMYNGRVQFSSGNTSWGNFGSVCGDIYGVYTNVWPAPNNVYAVIVEGISQSTLRNLNGNAVVSAQYDTVAIRCDTFNINGSIYTKKRFNQVASTEYVLVAPS